MPRRSKTDIENLRAEMLAHAATIFAKGEFHRTKTCDLAVAGKFSEGRFFTQFGSKDGILQAMFHEFWRMMYEITDRQCKAESDPIERVRLMLQVAVLIFREHEDLFRVTSVNCYPPERSPTLPDGDFHAKYRNLALRYITKAVKYGHQKNPGVDARLVYLSLLGAIQTSLNELYRERHFDKKPPRKQIAIADIERHLHFLLTGFFGGALQTGEDAGLRDSSLSGTCPGKPTDYGRPGVEEFDPIDADLSGEDDMKPRKDRT